MNKFNRELNKTSEMGFVSKDTVIDAATRYFVFDLNKLRRELNKIPSEMGWMSKESAVAAVKNLIEN